MKKNIFKRDDWDSIIVAITIVAIIFSGTFTVKHYQDRKEARRTFGGFGTIS